MNCIVQRPHLAPAKALLAEHCDHFFYAGKADDPAGLVGVQLHDDCALPRSLVVNPRVRSKGLGSALIQHAEEHARTVGVHTLYLLTTTAESDLCPANSAFMSKQLRGD